MYIRYDRCHNLGNAGKQFSDKGPPTLCMSRHLMLVLKVLLTFVRADLLMQQPQFVS